MVTILDEMNGFVDRMSTPRVSAKDAMVSLHFDHGKQNEWNCRRHGPSFDFCHLAELFECSQGQYNASNAPRFARVNATYSNCR